MVSSTLATLNWLPGLDWPPKQISRQFERNSKFKYNNTLNPKSHPKPYGTYRIMQFSQTTDLSPQGKLLVLIDFLSRDRIITFASASILKDLVFTNDASMLSLLPLLNDDDNSKSSSTEFITALYQVLDVHSEMVFDSLFSECTLDRAKSASKGERSLKKMNGDTPTTINGHKVEAKSLIYGEVEVSGD
mgnify:CR=1 FL=1